MKALFFTIPLALLATSIAQARSDEAEAEAGSAITQEVKARWSKLQIERDGEGAAVPAPRQWGREKAKRKDVVTLTLDAPTAVLLDPSGAQISVPATYQAGQYLVLNGSSATPSPISLSLSATTSDVAVETSETGPSPSKAIIALNVDGGQRSKTRTGSKPQSKTRTQTETAVALETGSTSSGGSDDSSDSENSSVKDQWLKSHNTARKKFGAPALVWEEGLVTKAANNAKQCAHAHSYVVIWPF